MTVYYYITDFRLGPFSAGNYPDTKIKSPVSTYYNPYEKIYQESLVLQFAYGYNNLSSILIT